MKRKKNGDRLFYSTENREHKNLLLFHTYYVQVITNLDIMKSLVITIGYLMTPSWSHQLKSLLIKTSLVIAMTLVPTEPYRNCQVSLYFFAVNFSHLTKVRFLCPF